MFKGGQEIGERKENIILLPIVAGERLLTQNTKKERTVAVRGEYITLGQLLKVVGTIGSGGEARLYLAETAVLVNGEPEQRRGRKLRPGDIVIPPGETPVHLLEADTETEEEIDE